MSKGKCTSSSQVFHKTASDSFAGSRARRQGLDGRQQRRVFLLQRFQINVFIVRGTGLPGAKQDANPLVSQSSQGGRVTFAVRPQLLIEGLGAATVLARMSSKLVPALAQELGTDQSQVHPAAATALFRDGGNPPVGDHLGGLLPALSLGAKSGQPPGCQDLARPGEVLK